MNKKNQKNKGIVARMILVIIATLLIVTAISYFDSRDKKSVEEKNDTDIASTTLVNSGTSILSGLKNLETASSSPNKNTATTTKSIDQLTDKDSWTLVLPKYIISDPLTFKIVTDKKTYTQNEEIKASIIISNNTEEPKTLKFESGCQTNYVITDPDEKSVTEFSSKDHTYCATYRNNIILPAKSKKQFDMVHNPSDYTLPVGRHAFTARIIGYGEAGVIIKVVKE